MAVVASGVLSLPLKYLRDTLAASASFQAWVGAADASAALAKILVVAGTTTGNYAVVDWADNWQREATAFGARNHFEQTGDLGVLLMQGTIGGRPEDEAAWTFLNTIGAIVAEMEALAGTPGYLDIRRFGFISRPRRPETDEAQTDGDFYEAILRVEYGGL